MEKRLGAAGVRESACLALALGMVVLGTLSGLVVARTDWGRQ